MKHPALVRFIGISYLLTAVCACSTLHPSGLVAGSKLDPLKTNPSEIALAVGVPDSLRLEDGDAQVRMAFEGGSTGSSVTFEETVPLQLRLSTGDGPIPNARDELVYVAGFTAEDAARIGKIQQKIREVRATGINGQGSLSINIVGGCFASEPPVSIEVSTWLQTDTTDQFVPLSRRVDVSRAIGERNAAILRQHLRPCAE